MSEPEKTPDPAQPPAEPQNYNRVARMDPLVAKAMSVEQHVEAFRKMAEDGSEAARRKVIVYLGGLGIDLMSVPRPPAIRSIGAGLTTTEALYGIGTAVSKLVENRVFAESHLDVLLAHVKALKQKLREGGR